MFSVRDIETIHILAEEYAEIASLPIQNEKKRLWAKLNGLKPERPMVAIDQVCWNELEEDGVDGGELALLCEDAECREHERFLRRALYQWKHFPADMVVEPFIRVNKAITNTGLGIEADVETLRTSETNDVVSQKYHNRIQSMADVEKLTIPVIFHDEAETARRMDTARKLFGGTLEVREYGWDPYLSVWDPAAMWMGAENVLYGLADEPEMMTALAERVVACYMGMLDQIEELGLLCHNQSLIHCTGAYTDELPAPGFDPAKPRAKDIWMFGLAQVFSSVSPSMFEEYEIETSMPLFKRFGLVYYGCCDPLDGKMKQVRRIPNLRKISMSPWADKRRGAEEIGKNYVFSNKPNPAFLAGPTFDEDVIRADLRETVSVCREHGCPLELILKDISTIGNHPERLRQWEKIAMEIALA